MKTGHGGHQRAHAGGNAYTHIQQVVQHKRRGSQQAHAAPQVFARDRVGAATVRVGIDRLPVGEVHNRQQKNDDEADGHDISQPGGTQRNQQRQRCLRPVRGGAKRI